MRIVCRSAVVALCLAALLGAVACSDDDDDERRSPTTAARFSGNACELLTEAEVRALLGGGELDAPVAAPTGSTCEWATRSVDQASLSITVDGSATGRPRYDVERRRAGTQPVTGVGDEAFYTRSGVEQALVARVGDRYVSLRALGSVLQPRDLRPPLTEAARTVVGKL